MSKCTLIITDFEKFLRVFELFVEWYSQWIHKNFQYFVLWHFSSSGCSVFYGKFNVFGHEIRSLCEKCPNRKFYLVCIFPYSVRIWENTDQKNSAFGHFSRIGHLCEWYFLTLSWRRLINQCIGFYMITASVMKGLSKTSAYLFQLRSRHPEMFCKKCILRNFTKFTELEVLRNF